LLSSKKTKFNQLIEEIKMTTSVVGYPRIGKLRELKFAIESYFKGDKSQNELLNLAKTLRATHWHQQTENEIDYISSNDFSFYDAVLDTANLLNVIPKLSRSHRYSLPKYYC